MEGREVNMLRLELAGCMIRGREMDREKGLHRDGFELGKFIKRECYEHVFVYQTGRVVGCHGDFVQV